MKDRPTLDFYAHEAEPYAARARTADIKQLEQFLAFVPPGGRILELGCGGGRDSEAMLAAGFDVTPTDGSPELARQAERRLGRPVRVLLFEDIDFEDSFDGVWANACLLHVPRADLGGVLGRVHAALKPGAAFYASFKAGGAEGRDRFGRFYNYPDEQWLRATYRPERWQRLELREGPGSGYDGVPTNWLNVLAIRLL